VTSRARAVGVAAVVVMALALPLFVTNFRLFQFTQVGVYAIALLGLNVLTGYSRQTAYRRLLVAPHGVRSGIVERID